MSTERNYWAVLAVLVFLMLVGRAWLYHMHLEQPLRMVAAQVLEVPTGSNFTRVVRELQAKGILNKSNDLLYHARFTQQAGLIKAGEYDISPELSTRGLLELLVSGRVRYHRVTLLEGWTLQQALTAIQAHPAITAVLPVNDPAALQRSFSYSQYPEGHFFPDTYSFTRGTTDLAVLEQAYALMQQQLESLWPARDPNLPLTSPDEALILASIIEKETARADERAAIAGVFVRRLERNMRLQTDPSVIYGLGAAFDGNLTRTQLQTDTPYNTYTRNGLPPTPIALPGRAALEASLHPAEGDTLYFVARGDGSHYFSRTLEEHQEAVRQYQSGPDEP